MSKQNTLFLKRLAALICCLALLMGVGNFTPAAQNDLSYVSAAEEDQVETVAFLDYTAGSWTNYNSSSPYARPATVTGAGTYTAGLDFSELAENKRPSGTQYIALQVVGATSLFPMHAIKLWGIKVNGTPLTITKKGYTNDEGGNTRMNLYIPDDWIGGAVPDGARSYDEDLEGVTWQVIAPNDLSSKIATLEIEFSFMPVGNSINTAYLGGDAMGSAGECWDAVPTNSSVRNTYVVGRGIYTVGVVSSSNIGTPNYALVLAGGADDYPGSVFRIIDVQVAGQDGVLESIPFSRGNTRDEGIHGGKNSIRTNIYNSYAAELGANDRTWDENPELMTPWVLESNSIQGKRQIFITFEFIPIDNGVPVEASLEYTDTAWDAAYLTAFPEESTGTPTTATFTNVGKYTVGVDFTDSPNGAANGVDIFRIRIKDGETNYPGWKIKVESVSIFDGSKTIIINPYSETNTIGFHPGLTYSPDGADMVYDFNNAALQESLTNDNSRPAGARIYDGLLVRDGYFATLGSTTQFENVESIEVTFRFQLGIPVEAPDINWAAHLRDADHNFYMGVQENTSYIFRNAWSEKEWGKHITDPAGYEEFDYGNLYRTDTRVNCGGTFTDSYANKLVDAAVGYDTYEVMLDIADTDLGFDGTNFTLLFVSTDIYYAAYVEGYVTIFDVVLEIDGIPVDTDDAFLITSLKDDRTDKTNPENEIGYDYLNINIINTYMPALKAFNYNMPTESIKLSFSVSYSLPPIPQEVKPVVEFDNDMATVGTVGTPVEIKFTATTANEFVTPDEFTYDVKVMRGTTNIDVELKDGVYSFTPDAAGDYLITVTAADDYETPNVSLAVSHEVIVSAAVDKAALQTKYDAVKNATKANKASISAWETFQLKLTAAGNVLADSTATQAEVDTALSELTTAYDAALVISSGCGSEVSVTLTAVAIFTMLSLAFVAMEKKRTSK